MEETPGTTHCSLRASEFVLPELQIITPHICPQEGDGPEGAQATTLSSLSFWLLVLK